MINNEKSSEDNENKYKHAIEKALKMGILDGYLDRKISEVINMLTCEYDYATDVAVQREEAYELGEKRGEERGAYSKAIETARNLINMGMSNSQISQATGLSGSEILALQ